MSRLNEFLKQCRELEENATKGPWNHESERYSAKNVIGVKPLDDRWIANCQPEFNGNANAEFIAFSRNNFLKLVECVEVLSEALVATEKWGYELSGFRGKSPVEKALEKVEEILRNNT